MWSTSTPKNRTTESHVFDMVARTHGIAFVAIYDPTNPVYLGSLRKTQGSQATTWRDVKVFVNHACVVADVVLRALDEVPADQQPGGHALG